MCAFKTGTHLNIWPLIIFSLILTVHIDWFRFSILFSIIASRAIRRATLLMVCANAKDIWAPAWWILPADKRMQREWFSLLAKLFVSLQQKNVLTFERKPFSTEMKSPINFFTYFAVNRMWAFRTGFQIFIVIVDVRNHLTGGK